MNYPVSVKTLLKDLAQTKGASDLLLTAGRPPQLRIYNQLVSLDYPLLDTADTEQLCRQILNKNQTEKFLREKDIDLSYAIAETGHLTLATLHTRGTVASVNRLIDMFPPEQSYQVRTQLAACLAGVIWQQLLASTDGKSLVLACEVLKAITSVRSLIRNATTHEIYTLMQAGRQQGMWTMEQNVESLLKRGKIKPDAIDLYN